MTDRPRVKVDLLRFFFFLRVLELQSRPETVLPGLWYFSSVAPGNCLALYTCRYKSSSFSDMRLLTVDTERSTT